MTWKGTPWSGGFVVPKRRRPWRCGPGWFWRVLKVGVIRLRRAVAADLGMSDETVGKWRARFLERRLDGLSDEPRSGRPRTVTDDDAERVIALTLETTPRDATHWSTRSMARRSGLSHKRLVASGGPSACNPTALKPSSYRRTPASSRRCGTSWVFTWTRRIERWCCAWTRSRRFRRWTVRHRRIRYCPCVPVRWNGAPMITCATARHGVALCRPGRPNRQSDWPLPPTTPSGGVSQVPRYHRVGGAFRPGRSPHRGQLRYPPDGADPEPAGQAATLPSALHPHQRILAESGGAVVCAAYGAAVASGSVSEQR